MKKLLKWMRGVSIDIQNRIYDILIYDNRLYLLVFWTKENYLWLRHVYSLLLGLFHLILEPLAFVDSLYRKIKRSPKVDDSTDEIPF